MDTLLDLGGIPFWLRNLTTIQEYSCLLCGITELRVGEISTLPLLHTLVLDLNLVTLVERGAFPPQQLQLMFVLVVLPVLHPPAMCLR